MYLTNYGASEAVLYICIVGTWINPPNMRNKNAPVILENKISCSLTFVCASSFRPSQYFFKILSNAGFLKLFSYSSFSKNLQY